HLDKKTGQSKSPLGNKGLGPHYHFNAISEEGIESDLNFWEKKYGLVWSTEESNTLGRDLLWSILPFALLIGFWIFMMRRMTGGGGGGASQIFNIGKSKAQVFGQGKGTNVSFKDVAGLEEAKEEIQEIVEFLKSPKKYTDL